MDSSTPAPAPGPTADALTHDAACAHCGYNLRGLPLTGRCPECGLAVRVTIASSLLVAAPAGWLRTVRLGLGLLAAAVVLVGIAPQVAMLLPMLLAVTGGQGSPRLGGTGVWPARLLGAGAVLALVGGLIVSVRNPLLSEQYRRISARTTLFVGVGVLPLLALLFAWTSARPPCSGLGDPVVHACCIAGVLSPYVLYIVTIRYAGLIGSRADTLHGDATLDLGMLLLLCSICVAIVFGLALALGVVQSFIGGLHAVLHALNIVSILVGMFVIAVLEDTRRVIRTALRRKAEYPIVT